MSIEEYQKVNYRIQYVHSKYSLGGILSGLSVEYTVKLGEMKMTFSSNDVQGSGNAAVGVLYGGPRNFAYKA